MRRAIKKPIAVATALFAVHGAALYWLGQPLICACGYITFYVHDIMSAQMSQQLFDWYTFSHIIHGFIFYAVLKVCFPRMSTGVRLLLSMGIEIGWEIAENTPWVINAYREQALAQGYVGDSIINSVFDTLAMMFGFVFARRMPIAVTIGLAILFEVAVALVIRDNLTLNILNFIYPFDFINEWQIGYGASQN